ncbi:MAG: AI-2E family transporter [Zoogloea sp.]|nr:AI-2E family transporter [Zoogloea sp.]
MIAALSLHLLAALFAGTMTYLLIQSVAKRVPAGFGGSHGRLVGVALIAVLVVMGMVGAGIGIGALLRTEPGMPALFQKMAAILDDAAGALPPWMGKNLPMSADELRATLVEWLRQHSAEMQMIGKEAGVGLVHLVVGIVVGVAVALSEAAVPPDPRPLAQQLGLRVRRFRESFRRVVFAQVKISAVNTILTGIYLLVVLPAMGAPLPFSKTMVAITFVVGLLPVVGNLISNTVIVVVSASQSFSAAAGSLVFLVVIHKLEYLLNARIVGGQIHARAWELLIAMLAMEAAFGIAGLAAAPVYYAYLKCELAEGGLV